MNLSRKRIITTLIIGQEIVMSSIMSMENQVMPSLLLIFIVIAAYDCKLTTLVIFQQFATNFDTFNNDSTYSTFASVTLSPLLIEPHILSFVLLTFVLPVYSSTFV